MKDIAFHELLDDNSKIAVGKNNNEIILKFYTLTAVVDYIL